MTEGAMRASSRRGIVPHVSGRGVLCALVVLFIAAPFIESVRFGDLIEAVALTLVLCAALRAVAEDRRALVWAVVLATPAVMGRWLYYLSPGLLPPDIHLAAGVATMAYVTVRFLHFVLRARRVTPDVLCAGISAFLMIALLWAFAYVLVDRSVPDSFQYTAGPASARSMTGFVALYFSLVTLCTVGFGDIVPVSNAARALAMFEGAVGVVFIAVLLSRLVSLYASEQESKAQP